MWQVESAIHEIEGIKGSHHHAKLAYRTPVARHAKNHEAQATSDEQLRTAENLLQQAASGLTGKPLGHVNAALTQLSTALSIK
jgi:hypothetical protein